MSTYDETPLDGADDGAFRPTRRRVLQVAAWTVPAVIVAQAAPALAGSGDPVTVVVGDGKNVCKFPGNGTGAYKGYAFSLRIENKLPCTTTVKIVKLEMDGVEQTIGSASVVNPDPMCANGNAFVTGNGSTIPTGGVVRLAVYTLLDTNSSSGTLKITYTYTTCAPNSTTVTATSTAELIGSPWTGGCRPFSYTRTQWDATTTGCPTFDK